MARFRPSGAGREAERGAPPAGAGNLRRGRRPHLVRAGGLARRAAVAALVAVALHLACEVLGGLVDCVRHRRGRAARAQGHALEAQGAFDDLAFLDRRVALLAELDLHHGERRDLTSHLLASLLDALPQLITDDNVAPLDLDAHTALLVLVAVTPCATDGTDARKHCNALIF